MKVERDRLLNLLVGCALVTAALPTVIVYRAAVQPRYHWGLFGIQGEGVTPGLFVIAGAAFLGWAAVVFGSLRTRAGGPLLIALNTVWFATILWGALRLGSRMTLRGDAWGMNINLAWVGPPIFAALLLLSIRWWWTRGRRLSGAATLDPTRVRRVLFATALALFPAIVVLFASGDGLHHTWTDRLAVVCVIAQCLSIGAALRPV
jgi:hypothetical protein